MAVLCLFTFRYMGPLPRPQDKPIPSFVAVPLKDAGMVGFKPIEEDEWVDASASAIQRNDLRVRIASVKTGLVALLEDKKPVVSRAPHLMIQVQVSYEGVARQNVPIETWADGSQAVSKHPPILTDNLKHSYQQTVFEQTLTVVARGETSDYLTSGRMNTQMLIFADPPAEVEFLRLELPGAALGLTGSFRFQIPRGMIQAAD